MQATTGFFGKATLGVTDAGRARNRRVEIFVGEQQAAANQGQRR